MRSSANCAYSGWMAALAVGVCAPGALGQDYTVGPRTYYLHQPSSFQQGCWGDCLCPLTLPEPMRGTFTLALITVGDVTDFYSVSNVNWFVPRLAGQPFNVTIAGSGNFAAGQVPWADHQNMWLDLTAAPQPGPWAGVGEFFTTLESGMRTVPPPVIDMEVANSATGCPGVRLRIVASWYKSDWNGDGAVNVADIFALLRDYFGGGAKADYNGDGLASVADIMAMLGDWFAGV